MTPVKEYYRFTHLDNKARVRQPINLISSLTIQSVFNVANSKLKKTHDVIVTFFARLLIITNYIVSVSRTSRICCQISFKINKQYRCWEQN